MISTQIIPAILVAVGPLVCALPQATQVTTTTSGTTVPLGALSTTVLAPSIPALPPSLDASFYPRDGKLHTPQPAPFTPAGGLGTNGREPNYQVKSDFDFFSLVSRNSVCCRLGR